jgi:hypothetical protein
VVTHHVRHARGDEENEPDEELSHHVEVVRPLRLLGLHPCAHLVRRTLPRSGSGEGTFKFNCQANKKKEIASSVGGGPRGLESPMQKPNVASSGPDARSVSARRELSSLPAKGKR